MSKRFQVLFISLVLVMAALAGGSVGYMFSQARAQRAIRFIENLVHVDGQFYGQPFKLLPWERQIIRDVYGTVLPDGRRQYKRVYIEIPKKNGKSELGSGVVLYHTFADGEVNGEIYGCAAEKNQAGIIYKTAMLMTETVPALDERSRIADSIKEIQDKVSGSIYKVLSSEAYSKHGYKPSCVMFDELHAQPNRDLYDVMTFGTGATRRQPIWWFLTTAGDDPDRVSIGWEVHDQAMKILAARDGTGNPEDDDPTWYVTIFNYEGDDIWNEANWFVANPGLGLNKSLESMREDARDAKKDPAKERLFRWLHLDQWITTKLTPWLPLDLFDQTVGDWNSTEMLGRDCYLGMDLSSTTDLTAICLVFPPQGTQYDWRAMWFAWMPRENMEERIKRDHVRYDLWEQGGYLIVTDGNVVDYTKVEEKILELKKLYRIMEVDSDPAFATMLLQRLQQADLICVGIPQTFVGLTDPMNQTEILLKGPSRPAQGADAAAVSDQQEGDEEVSPLPGANLLQGRLTHEKNPVARWCFGNTSVATQGSGLKKYVKETKGRGVVRTKRIDLTAALIMAVARARFYKGSVDLSAKILDDDYGM